jgi:hypothetical protein
MVVALFKQKTNTHDGLAKDFVQGGTVSRQKSNAAEIHEKSLDLIRGKFYKMNTRKRKIVRWDEHFVRISSVAMSFLMACRRSNPIRHQKDAS